MTPITAGAGCTCSTYFTSIVLSFVIRFQCTFAPKLLFVSGDTFQMRSQVRTCLEKHGYKDLEVILKAKIPLVKCKAPQELGARDIDITLNNRLPMIISCAAPRRIRNIGPEKYRSYHLNTKVSPVKKSCSNACSAKNRSIFCRGSAPLTFRNSLLLRVYASCPICRDLGLIIKHWAHSRDIVDVLGTF